MKFETNGGWMYLHQTSGGLNQINPKLYCFLPLSLIQILYNFLFIDVNT